MYKGKQIGGLVGKWVGRQISWQKGRPGRVDKQVGGLEGKWVGRQISRQKGRPVRVDKQVGRVYKNR